MAARPEIKQWYQNVPKDADIDESLFSEPFASIFKSVAVDLKSLDINYVCNVYGPVMSTFFELSASYRASSPNYNKTFLNFLTTICDLYKIERTTMVVYPNKYTTKDWGNVYWEFLHLSSILVSYAFENGMINSFLDFTTIVKNIDCILPCPKCRHHYEMIKNSEDVKAVMKSMSFGAVMISLQIFHNIVTANVDKTADYANIPNRDRFLISDFALKYKCVDLQDENLRASTGYIKPTVDWQPTTHALLCIILSTYCSQPSYDRASILIKQHLYKNRKEFKDVVIPSRSEEFKILDTSDAAYEALTAKQLMYCLMRALLLQFQDTTVTAEAVQANKRLNYAIITMYRLYNTEIRTLVANNLTDPSQEALKNMLLGKLEKVRDMEFGELPTH
ncbi:Ac92-like protein [Tomelloso virus]|uniref:Sulfhydryl oxidase n=1 Tax=Tomelloso virus TaxID=2053981 RepID=A0A2H4T2P6_9VIRU|nr:Ac92-like protein [Tomelloso virus]ATY70201.1 Ac92-like protein [Tomelloso virus]